MLKNIESLSCTYLTLNTVEENTQNNVVRIIYVNIALRFGFEV